MFRAQSLLVLLAVAACSEVTALDPPLPRTVWGQTIRGPALVEVLAVATTPEGVLAAGVFEQTVRVGSATVAAVARRDVFVARFDQDGRPTDLQSIPRADVVILRAASVLGGQPWIAGTFFGNQLAWPGAPLTGEGSAEGFALRLDEAGQAVAAAVFGGPGRQILSQAAALPDGGVWLAGRFEGQLSSPSAERTAVGAADGFITRLDAAGAPQVEQAFGGTDKIIPTALTTMPDGGATLAFLFEGPGRWGGQRWSAPTGERASLIVRVDATATPLWQVELQGDAEIATLSATPDGGVVATGVAQSELQLLGRTLPPTRGIDVFVLRLEGSGEFVAARRFSGTDADLVRGAAVDPSGHVWLAGTFSSDLRVGSIDLNAEAARDLFVARLAPDLTPRWAIQLSSPLGERVAADLVIADDGAAIVGAGYVDAIDWGAGPVPGEGALDGAVIKVRP